MPELAEVEFFRRQWDPGLRCTVRAVSLHPRTRVFRGQSTRRLQEALPGTRLLGSEVHGKQMLFRFSRSHWLALHLGMTGKLQAQPAGYLPSPYDHFVLHQPRHALVFSDPRQFGRVTLEHGPRPPEWWRHLPPRLNSPQFTRQRLATLLQRHARAPVKATLLIQDAFPGIGNWMADEILWRSRLHPWTRCGRIAPVTVPFLWKTIRWVCRRALETVGQDFSDPPRGWLFHQRWDRGGLCPKHREPLRREAVGGRTTAWCDHCQKAPRQS